jgi:hypothetical protein
MNQDNKSNQKYTDSDKLAIALACLAGIMAIVLSLVEKTIFSVIGLLALMFGLCIYPIVHFVKATSARIELVAIALLGISAFGWTVWPKSTKVEAQSQPIQQPQEPPKTDAYRSADPKVVKYESPSTPQLPKSQPKPDEKGNSQYGSITQSCGSIQQGGTGNQANVNCDYRDPLPPIDVTLSTPIAAGMEPALSAMTGERPNGPLIDKPGALVTITVKGAFRTPAFAADCDVPCALVSQLSVEGDVSRSLSSQFNIRHRLDNMGALIIYNAQMYPGSTIKLTFRSLDGRPLTVSNVRAYDPIQK